MRHFTVSPPRPPRCRHRTRPLPPRPPAQSMSMPVIGWPQPSEASRVLLQFVYIWNNGVKSDACGPAQAGDISPRSSAAGPWWWGSSELCPAELLVYLIELAPTWVEVIGLLVLLSLQWKYPVCIILHWNISQPFCQDSKDFQSLKLVYAALLSVLKHIVIWSTYLFWSYYIIDISA